MENAQGLGRSLEAKWTLRDPHSRYLAPKLEESTELLNCKYNKYYKYLCRAFGSTLTTVQVLYIVKLSTTEPG
jgi:hypothetical protein